MNERWNAAILLKDNRLHLQAVRYLAVGVGVYFIDLGAFLLLLLFAPAAYILANIIAKVVGAATGFALHKRFTYSWAQSGVVHKQAVGYALLLGANLCISSGLIYLGVSVFALPTVAVKIAADVVIIVATFIITRTVIFKRRDESDGSS